MLRFLNALTRKPSAVVAVLLGLGALLVFFMLQNTQLVTDMDEYMPSDHPAFVYSRQAEDLFGLNSAILLVLEHPDGIYNPTTLAKIREISQTLPERFTQIPEDGITSLATADNIRANDWGLEVEAFFEEIPQSPEALTELRRRVEANSLVHGRMVSLDGRSAMIVAEITDGSFDRAFYDELLAFAGQWEGPEVLRVAGRPIVEGELAKLGPRDMAQMAPLVLVLMTLLLLVLLRSVRDTGLNLIIVGFGVLAAFGTKSLLGIPIYSVDTMMPVMLIAIGVAYGIHMHNALHHLSKEHPDWSRRDLAEASLKAMLRPVFLTALTTAVGFVSLVTSEILPVRYFGLFIALGVLVEMVLALILFPASVYLLGPVRKGKETVDEFEAPSRVGNLVKGPGGFLSKHGVWILGLAAILSGAAVWGSTKIWIDTSFLANFQKDSPLVLTDEFVNENFGGTSVFYVVFEGTKPDTFKDPAVLSRLDALQSSLNEIPEVGDSFGLTNFIRQLNRVLTDDLPASERIPDSQEIIAQYLLLFEMSGDPDSLGRVVDYDYQRANLTLRLKSDSSALITQIIQRLDAETAGLAELGITMGYAGSGYKAYVFSQLLLKGQILSLALSFVIIALLLALMFRSKRLGLVGTVPIAITAVINFGTMGLFGIPLSSATALISSIAIGIGVDYAIHLMEYYILRRQAGDSIDWAVKETLSHTGRAILFNAVTVMGGFGVLLFSVFPPNQQVGGLIALNMFTSALGTLTVLLVLMMYLDRKGLLLKNLKIQEEKAS